MYIFQTKSNDVLNIIDVLKDHIKSCNIKLLSLAEDITSALNRKKRGKSGVTFKFVFNVKYYGGYKYTSESSAITDKDGKRVVSVSDGLTLVRRAVNEEKRDLFAEINSLLIAPLSSFPHADIVAAEELLIAEECEQKKAADLAYRRQCAENEILAQKRDEAKKRKRAEAAQLLAAAAASDSSASVGALSTKKSKAESTKPSGRLEASHRSRNRATSDDEEERDFESEGGITLSDYKGGDNDAANLRRVGREKPLPTGDFDLLDKGYADVDDSIVKSLRASGDVRAVKNYILRGGKVSSAEFSNGSGGVRARMSLSDKDDEFNDADVGASMTKQKRKSELEDMTFDDCEGPSPNRKYIQSNDIDENSSSDEESDDGSVRTKPLKPIKKRVGSVRRPTAKERIAKGKEKPKTRAQSDSSDEDAALFRSSSDSDVPKKKRIPKTAATAVDADGEEKPRKVREPIGLSEQQVTQYSNVNLVPFQMTAAQRQQVHNERFEVDGKLMSEDEIKNLILGDVDVISKNIDAKFLSFVRQHIMVDVFKDVHFISNVIQFYRMKRFLHSTQGGDHIICLWQIVLKDVASDLINELVTSNKKILELMDKNLLDLKEYRREQRHQANLVIGSDEDRERIAADFMDLMEYKEQMKLSRKALEDIEKVMKRKVNSVSHSLGAKIGCIWAKLNGFQHLLRGNMSKIEKKFLLDPTMPFYSVLCDDLSRKWGGGNVVASPNGLFQGINLLGSNRDDSLLLTELDTRSASMVSSQSGSADVRMLHVSFVDRDIQEVDLDSPSSPSVATSQQSSSDDESVVAGDSELDANRVSQQQLEHPVYGGAEEVEEETQKQSDDVLVDQEGLVNEGKDVATSFSSPHNTINSSADSDQQLTRFSSEVREEPPCPTKDRYMSALLNAGRNGSPSTPDSQLTENRPELNSLDNDNKRHRSKFHTPVVPTPPSAGLPTKSRGSFVISSHGNNSSCLSSISSGSSSSSGSPNDLFSTANNTATLFNELKNMSQDTRSVESMKRFIEVMNEKPPNVIMPVTSEEEEKILSKAKAKKKKEEAKVVALALGAKNAAAVVASAVSKMDNVDIPFSSDDEARQIDGGGSNVAAVRLKTNSYALFQKVFLFICKKHVEVKDAVLNMQFSGQRLARSLDNSVLLKFLLFVLRNKDLVASHLAVYFMDERAVCEQFKCSFGIAYDANDYFNILGDGYCVLRSMYALYCNEQCGYKLSTAAMKLSDRALLKSVKSRREFFAFMNSIRDSINIHCNDPSSKLHDKKKLKTMMTIFGSYPQLKQVPSAYWACLDWVTYVSFNCTAFSTNHPDCVPGYAQLHCSSVLRRDMPSANIGVVPFSLGEINNVLTKPFSPSFCVLEGQHAFVVQSPDKEAVILSFKNVLGLFLEKCQQSVAVLGEKFVVDFPVVEVILEKMIADNLYALNEAEANLMTDIVKHIDSLEPPAVVQERIVFCVDDDVVPSMSFEAFSSKRDGNSGEVVDLCDSDTGDVDRVKVRAAKVKLAQSQQELFELTLKVGEYICYVVNAFYFYISFHSLRSWKEKTSFC